MTELSYWWSTSGTPSGHQVASYTEAHLAKVAAIIAASGGFEGILANYLNELVPADGGANTVSIGTGGAVVDGRPYLNDASVNVNVPSAVGGGNTRIDRIVLRASWSAYTVEITRIAGTDAASPTVPAITQTSGTTYDIKICQVLVDTAGDVTVTDERVWSNPPVDDVTLEVSNGKLQVKALGVDTAQIATDAVTSAKIDALAVTAAEIANLTITGGKLANGAVDTDQLASLAVTEAKIATNSINNAHMKDNAVDTLEINNLAVTTGKIDDLAVTGAKIANLTITGGKLANGAVDTDQLASLAVTGAKIDNKAVDTGQIADSAIQQLQMDANSVGTSELINGNVTLLKMATNSVDTGQLVNDAVTNAKIDAGAVDTTELANAAVTTAKIAGNAVDGTKLGTEAIRLYKRIGGNSTSFGVQGTTWYSITDKVTVQTGVYRFTSVSAGGTATVSFALPQAYGTTPMVICSVQESSDSGPQVAMASASSTNLTLRVYNQDTVAQPVTVAYMVIGQWV